MIVDLVHKIKKNWIKLWLQPIRVYCLHHVCAKFDAESMYQEDWMNIEAFKIKVTNLQKIGVKFISLFEAYRHICKDRIRGKKYAVLTFDDGYSSLKEILPWLEEQNIPCTLFINGKYMDGKSYRKDPKEKYLTKNELFALSSPLIEIGNHGWEHKRLTEISKEEFAESLEKNSTLLSTHPNYVPFWAYAYGTHTVYANRCLHERNLIPVYIDRQKNYNDHDVIHRELLK